MSIFSDIPFIGEIVDNITEKSYKEKLKNKLQRAYYTGIGSAVFLPGVVAAFAAIGLAIAGDNIDEIKAEIDNISEEEAQNVLIVIDTIGTIPGSPVYPLGVI